MSERKTSQQRKDKFKANKPWAESVQKEKERQRASVLRFHIARNFLYGYGLPESVDQTSDIFQRVREQYLIKVSQPVEVLDNNL